MFKVDLAKRREEILNGSLLKATLILSFPIIVMNIISALISLIDALFANNLLGNEVFSAISYSQPTINIMIAMSQGLCVVAMAIIGKAVGEKNDEKVKFLSLQILMWSIILSILLIPICHMLSYTMSMTASFDIRDNVYKYISLYSFILPFYFIAGMYNSIKNVTGEPEATFYRLCILLILKLIFNYLFLYILRLDISGTMYSTLVSYIILLVWMYHDLFIRKSLYQLSLKKYKINFSVIKTVMILAVPSMLNYMMINLGFLLINVEVIKYGSKVVTALGIANQINNLCFLMPSSIATAITTMVSVNIGSHKVKRAKKSYYLGIRIGLLIGMVMLIIILKYNRFFISFFTHNTQIIKVAEEALNTYTYTIFPFTIFIIAQSVLNAMGRTKIPLIMGIFRIWVIRYVFIIITQQYLGYFSVFYGNLISNIITAIIIFIVLLKIKWKSVVKIVR